MKADRLPAWAVRRLNPEQRQAYNLLRWYDPGPAERARLKRVLGWRRTREETFALTCELIVLGRTDSAIRDELGCSERHLRRVFSEIEAEQGGCAEKPPRKPSAGLEKTDTTCESGIATHRENGHKQPSPYDRLAPPPMKGFATAGDLDRWLEEHRP